MVGIQPVDLFDRDDTKGAGKRDLCDLLRQQLTPLRADLLGVMDAVNRNPACRCALVSEPLSAALAREHNDANIIALGARLTGSDMAKACIDAFLAAGFGGGRHAGRVAKLSNPQL